MAARSRLGSLCLRATLMGALALASACGYLDQDLALSDEAFALSLGEEELSVGGMGIRGEGRSGCGGASGWMRRGRHATLVEPHAYTLDELHLVGRLRPRRAAIRDPWSAGAPAGAPWRVVPALAPDTQEPQGEGEGEGEDEADRDAAARLLEHATRGHKRFLERAHQGL